MGGLFSAPSPPPPPPPPPAPDLEGEAAKNRKEQMERQRPGRLGTIATSFRGVLQPHAPAARRKSLLGE